jgi:hypothetical protein
MNHKLIPCYPALGLEAAFKTSPVFHTSGGLPFERFSFSIGPWSRWYNTLKPSRPKLLAALAATDFTPHGSLYHEATPYPIVKELLYYYTETDPESLQNQVLFSMEVNIFQCFRRSVPILKAG